MTTEEHTLKFALHEREIKFREDIFYLIEKIFKVTNGKIITFKKHKGVTLSFNSTFLANFFKQFGQSPNTKFVPDVYLLAKKYQLSQMVYGFVRGDGHSADPGHLSFTTVSPLLAGQLLFICYSLEWPMGLHKSRPAKGRYDAFKLDIYGSIAQEIRRFAHLVERFHRDSDTDLLITPRYTETDDYWLMPIEKIERKEFAGHVYNFTVDVDNSYFTELGLVHNCGSGTTAAVAEKLGRRWIACDLSKFAIHTTRKRFLSIEGVKPFVVQNLGKYERQAWMKAEFSSNELIRYYQFILELYHATPINSYRWLHGVRAGRMVHVGSVDAPITIGDVKGVVTEFWKSVGKSARQEPRTPTEIGTPIEAKTNGVDILGWEFAFELNEVAKQIATEANVNIAFKKIPREVLDKRAVEQGDIRFFELAALSVDVECENSIFAQKKVTLELTDFVIPPDDVPEDVQRAITHWGQWIDYWAVDWDFKDDTFHNQWQSYRTKKEPNLQKEITHTYDEAGVYTVVVKVIDILGNDTTKVMEVEIT